MSTAANGGWVWLDAQVMRAVHEEQLAEHGGGGGVRDEGLFDSAMNRPLHLAAYGEPDAAALAAACGFGLARNHPFVDGNKRTARIVSNALLVAHGYCPLSFRTVDSIDYKKAMLLFYEQNNVSAFKRIFIEQFAFALKTYF